MSFFAGFLKAKDYVIKRKSILSSGVWNYRDKLNLKQYWPYHVLTDNKTYQRGWFAGTAIENTTQKEAVQVVLLFIYLPLHLYVPPIAFPRMRSYGLCPGSLKRQMCSSPAPFCPQLSGTAPGTISYHIPFPEERCLLCYTGMSLAFWTEERNVGKKKTQSLKNVTMQVFCHQGSKVKMHR